MKLIKNILNQITSSQTVVSSLDLQRIFDYFTKTEATFTGEVNFTDATLAGLAADSISATNPTGGTNNIQASLNDLYDPCTVSRVEDVYNPAWTVRTTPLGTNWSSVTYGNGIWVAVSAFNTTDKVMTSSDGINWTARSAAVDNSWTSVTYGNGVFVAVSDNGTGNQVMTSTDGITWVSRTNSTDNPWSSVTYGNGLFVAVCPFSTNGAMTSPDGITWTSQTTPLDGGFSVTYGDGLFVAVAYTGTNRVMTSTDGVTWTGRTAVASSWNSVTYGNGTFVAAASSGTNRVMTSTDGITWVARTVSPRAYYAVTYGNGVFVLVGNLGMQWSLNGITWNSVTIAPGERNFKGVAYGNRMFVVVAHAISSSTELVRTSIFDQVTVCPENPYGGDNTMQGIIDSLYDNSYPISGKTPVWTTATRPTPTAGQYLTGFNTTTSKHEGWDGSAWNNFY